MKVNITDLNKVNNFAEYHIYNSQIFQRFVILRSCVGRNSLISLYLPFCSLSIILALVNLVCPYLISTIKNIIQYYLSRTVVRFYQIWVNWFSTTKRRSQKCSYVASKDITLSWVWYGCQNWRTYHLYVNYPAEVSEISGLMYGRIHKVFFSLCTLFIYLFKDLIAKCKKDRN